MSTGTVPPPERPALQLVAILSDHLDKAWHLAWNPRAPLLASCSSDKNVRLHRFTFQSDIGGSVTKTTFSLQEVVVTGHKRTVRQVAWSPSGKILATASFDATVGIWEQLDAGHDSDDGHLAPQISSNGGGPEWDCIGTLEGHDSECKSIAFSRKGDLLASCSRDKSVWIWEVHPDSEFECLSVLMEHSQDVKAVAWHPNEEILASASYDDSIKLYLDDPSDDWYCYQTLTGHTSTVWAIAFSPCGNFLASASDDLTVRIWRRLTVDQAEKQGLKVYGQQPGRPGDHWACTNVLKGWHARTIYSVSWGRTTGTDKGSLGRIATGGGDGKIFVFEVFESEDPETSLVPTTTLVAAISEAHGVCDINSVAWAPASLAPTPEEVQADQTARITELPSDGDEDRRNIAAGGHPHLCDLLASAGDDGSVKVWAMPSSPLAYISP